MKIFLLSILCIFSLNGMSTLNDRIVKSFNAEEVDVAVILNKKIRDLKKLKKNANLRYYYDELHSDLYQIVLSVSNLNLNNKNSYSVNCLRILASLLKDNKNLSKDFIMDLIERAINILENIHSIELKNSPVPDIFEFEY